MLSINDYLLQYQRKIPNILLMWTLIIAFIIIFLMIINNNFTIDNYYLTRGIVKDKYLSIYVLAEDLEKITVNNTIYINGEKYSYKIKKIGEIIVNGTNYYKEVLLDINLKNKYFIDNNIIDVKFIIEKKAIFRYITNLLEGG